MAVQAEVDSVVAQSDQDLRRRCLLNQSLDTVHSYQSKVIGHAVTVRMCRMGYSCAFRICLKVLFCLIWSLFEPCLKKRAFRGVRCQPAKSHQLIRTLRPGNSISYKVACAPSEDSDHVPL